MSILVNALGDAAKGMITVRHLSQAVFTPQTFTILCNALEDKIHDLDLRALVERLHYNTTGIYHCHGTFATLLDALGIEAFNVITPEHMARHPYSVESLNVLRNTLGEASYQIYLASNHHQQQETLAEYIAIENPKQYQFYIARDRIDALNSGAPEAFVEIPDNALIGNMHDD